MNEAYLIGGGEADARFISSFLMCRKEGSKIIAVDAGLRHLDKAGFTPDILVGDFDSVQTDILKKYTKHRDAQIYRYSPVKDASDLELAVQICHGKRFRRLYMLACSGGRLDHMLANIFLLCKWVSRGMELILLDQYNKIYAVEKSLRIYKKEQYGNYISFFPMGGRNPEFSIYGVKYPVKSLKADKYDQPSLTISNEIEGEFAEIELSGGMLLVIESKDVKSI